MTFSGHDDRLKRNARRHRRHRDRNRQRRGTIRRHRRHEATRRAVMLRGWGAVMLLCGSAVVLRRCECCARER